MKFKLAFAAVSAAVALTAWAADWTDGEVRKIDTDRGVATLRHGPIKNLDMPPMTMVFRFKNSADLARLKVGDKVRFAVENANGALTVTAIETPPAQ